MSPSDQTVQFVELSEHLTLARLGYAMRQAQKTEGKRRFVRDAERRFDAAIKDALARERLPLPGIGDHSTLVRRCTAETPCCSRRGEYNGFGSGPTIFTCPNSCSCHD